MRKLLSRGRPRLHYTWIAIVGMPISGTLSAVSPITRHHYFDAALILGAYGLITFAYVQMRVVTLTGLRYRARLFALQAKYDVLARTVNVPDEVSVGWSAIESILTEQHYIDLYHDGCIILGSAHDG